MPLISFSRLISLVVTSSWCRIKVERMDILAMLPLLGKISPVLATEHDIRCRLRKAPVTSWKTFPSIPCLLRVFTMSELKELAVSAPSNIIIWWFSYSAK